MGIAKAKETDMKTLKLFALVLLALVALLGMGGCTDESTRAILTVVEVNEGRVFFSDLINEADTAKIFIPVDEAIVTFGNIQNDGGAPLEPGAPFSEIIVTGYSVTYDNGIYSPVSGGMNVRVPSGSTAEATIALSSLAEKASLPLNTAVTTTARLTFTGFVHTNGGNNGDAVTARANMTVQVANFGDTDVNE